MGSASSDNSTSDPKATAEAVQMWGRFVKISKAGVVAACAILLILALAFFA